MNYNMSIYSRLNPRIEGLGLGYKCSTSSKQMDPSIIWMLQMGLFSWNTKHKWAGIGVIDKDDQGRVVAAISRRLQIP